MLLRPPSVERGQIIPQHSHEDFIDADTTSFSLLLPLHDWVNILAHTSPNVDEAPNVIRVNQGTILCFNSKFIHAGGCNDCGKVLYRLHFYICKKLEDIPVDAVYTTR